MKQWMQSAFEQAQRAYRMSEVPVGAVLVKDGSITDSAYNLCKAYSNPLNHAEMLLLNRAFEREKLLNLQGYELYVTLEPCPMCAAAALTAGISKIVFGAYDFDFGGLGGFVNTASHPSAKKTEVYGGIMEKECTEILQRFFKELR